MNDVKVSHFTIIKDVNGEDLPYSLAIAKYWVLLYPDGYMCSFNYDDIRDNIFSMLEQGIPHFCTSVDIVVSLNYFPDVFKSCIGQEYKPKYTFSKH